MSSEASIATVQRGVAPIKKEFLLKAKPAGDSLAEHSANVEDLKAKDIEAQSTVAQQSDVKSEATGLKRPREEEAASASSSSNATANTENEPEAAEGEAEAEGDDAGAEGSATGERPKKRVRGMNRARKVAKGEATERPRHSGQMNFMPRELMISLRKRKYNFDKAIKVAKEVQKEYDRNRQQQNAAQKANSSSSSKAEAVVASDTKATPQEATAVPTTEAVVPTVEPSTTTAVATTTEGAAVAEVPAAAAAATTAATTTITTTTEAAATTTDSATTTTTTAAAAAETAASTSETQSSVLDKDMLTYIETRLHERERRKMDFRGKLVLAPLTTLGNLPYRRICKSFGVDVTIGEMAVASNILQASPSEWALLRRHESEDLFGVQLAGGYPDQMAKCAQVIEENLKVDFIDVNCGCPIDLICRKGMGAGLLEKTAKMEQIVRSMKRTVDIPISVKVRTGTDIKRPFAHNLFPRIQSWGADAITIHGRSRNQRYTKEADWDYVGRCASLVDIPVIGNGDIFSYVEYQEHLEHARVDSVMVARGALIKPWIFTELKESRHWDISATERLDILRTFVDYGLDHWGADEKGQMHTRRFLLEWLSFLYRYIPVGLLEVLPQRMNDRPPPYYCRNELETLMASPNVADWIKISEMLMGPTPASFTFTPKHKSNAYATNASDSVPDETTEG